MVIYYLCALNYSIYALGEHLVVISLGLFPEIWRVGVTTLGSLDADIIGGGIVLMYFR